MATQFDVMAYGTSAHAAAAAHLRFQLSFMVGSTTSSPIYEHLLERAAEDAEAGGPCFAVLAESAGDDPASALALRFLGAVHRIVLGGRAPELARHYPSAGGGDEGDPWPAFRKVVADHVEELRESVKQGVQTNEVGRSSALFGGFHDVARRWRLPLRTLEAGASAGLNLRWDRYRYEAGEWAWGDPSSPVRLRDAFVAGVPPVAHVEVVERRGCDRSPVDATSDEGRLLLESFLWPDHVERLRLLRAAIEVARDVPVEVEEADAVEWLDRRLAEPTPEIATVVYHSIFIQYLSSDARRAFVEVIRAAGERATAEAPLAWLRMEPPGDLASVWLTTWPGGERVIAETGYHGRPVHWKG